MVSVEFDIIKPLNLQECPGEQYKFITQDKTCKTFPYKMNKNSVQVTADLT